MQEARTKAELHESVLISIILDEIKPTFVLTTTSINFFPVYKSDPSDLYARNKNISSSLSLSLSLSLSPSEDVCVCMIQ